MSAILEVRSHHAFATNIVNVWHWQIPNVAPVTEAQTCIDAINTMFTNLVTRFQAGVMTVEGLCKTVGPGGGQFVQGTTKTSTMTGSTVLPLSTCIVVALKSDFVGRSRRGRKFMGPLAAGAMNADGRTVASTVKAAFLTEFQTLQAVSTNGVALGVFSRKTNVFTETNTCAVNDVLGTQRHRLT